MLILMQISSVWISNYTPGNFIQDVIMQLRSNYLVLYYLFIY